MRFLISSVTCGNHLHRFAEIIAAPFLVEDGLIDLAAGKIVDAGQLDVGEALIMAEVEVRFRAVVEHINFTVLIGAHRARIDIEIRVELLQRDFQAAIFEQRAQGRRRQAFAQRTHHTARYKNIFHDKSFSTRATSAGTSTPTLS